VDPNEAPVRREPKNGHDLIVAARNGLIVAFDNVSSLPLELSDDLARPATGSGFGARQLYTDLEEVIVHVARPIAVNGIEEVATKGDVLDRSLVLMLPTIDTYKDEDSFWADFQQAHPKILGALLTAAACALRNLDKTAAPNVRMADFARWVNAAEPAFDLDDGTTFITSYRANRASAVQLTLESSPLTGPVTQLAATGFEGTATEPSTSCPALSARRSASSAIGRSGRTHSRDGYAGSRPPCAGSGSTSSSSEPGHPAPERSAST
jgi:hypothetical protein